MLMSVGMFAATLLAGGPENMGAGFNGGLLSAMGAMDAVFIQFRGEWWRFLTAGFLHGGLLHIGMNMLGLYQLGNEVEELFGTHRYIAIYVFSTMTGFYTSYKWGTPLSVGASAAVFGLLGAQIAYAVLRGSSHDKQYYTRIVVYSFLMSAMLFGRTDNAAHLGGAVGGFGVAWLAGLPRIATDWREQLWQVIGWFAIGLVVLSYVTWAWRYVL